MINASTSVPTNKRKMEVVKEWTPEEIDLLIHLVRERPDLYDQTRTGYSNLNVIENTWKEIAECLPLKDDQLCKYKWQILRGTYRTKRHEYHAASGSTTKRFRKWPYFDAMCFLERHITERKSNSNTVPTIPAISPKIEYLEITEPELSFNDVDVDPLDVQVEDTRPAPIPPVKQEVVPIPSVPQKSKKTDVDDCFMQYLQQKKPKTSISLFLQSLEEDMEKLSPQSIRKLKLKMLAAVQEELEAEGKDDI